MNRIPATAKALCAGLVVTILQIVVAIFLLAPEGPFEYRYRTLVQHDSYWCANIVDRVYQTIVPPISHRMMEVSSTGFFPASRALAWILHRALSVAAEDPSVVNAQAAA